MTTTSEAIDFIKRNYRLIYANSRSSAYSQYSYVMGLINMADVVGIIDRMTVSTMKQEVQNIYDAHVDALRFQL